MDAERWKLVQQLFEAGLERAAEERDGGLAAECAGDAGLEQEIRSLLDADNEDRVGDIVSGAARSALEDEAPGLDGETVGAYRILHELGRGGMGTVYLAERADGQFEQQVAIKVVRERLARPDLVERFRDERQILARLDHPNIARLLDGGTTPEGSPFVVMELVEGRPLDIFCDERDCPVEDRLRLFLFVCDAVNYAHRNLIVHRDLKPSNVLVTAGGVPKLLDFGVAKLLGEAAKDGAEATRTVARMMTPEYASPEQVRGEPVSTASDVYSLGVMLYVLLTGGRPYRTTSAAPGELERAVVEQQPDRPSAKRRELDADLDNIVLKALRKEPERRYASALELADDIGRHLDGMPVHARPATWSYRGGKFIGRHKLGVAAAAVTGLILVSSAVVSTTLFLRANRAQDTAEQINRFLSDMLGSVNPAVAQGEDATLLRRVLDETAGRIEKELSDRPEVAANLHQTIGSTYHSLGLFEQAERHHREGLRLNTETFGERGNGTPQAIRSLSSDLRELSRYDESEALARRALSLSQEIHGVEHVETAADSHNVGMLLHARSHAVDAEPFVREALRVRRKVLGDAHPLVAETLLLLGQNSVVPPIDDLEQAQESLLEAQEIWRNAGDRHLFQRSDVAHALGDIYVGRELWEDAERSYRESLKIKRRILPERHPSTAVTLNRLASMFEMMGDFAAAEPTYREALAIQREVLDPDHRDLGTTINNLAGTLRKSGRYGEAAGLYAEAVEIYGKAMGPEHAWVGIVLGSLAANHEAAGAHVACERTADECLRVRRMEWDADHWRNATVESIRGACIRAQGRYAESEAVLLRAAPLVEAGLGPEHPSTRQAYARIVDLYEAWGRPDRAAEFTSVP